MKTAILIKTCLHDAEYHRYCLKSIEKFCTGFSEVRVIEGEHPKGYLWQQVVKLHADQYTDADFILVTDSDTLFVEPVTPESFMREGKPIWFMTPWTPEMLATEAMQTWWNVMRDFNGAEPPAEFMRRQPFMFPRHVLQSIREHCFHRFGVGIEEFIMAQPTFTEWNAMGHHCWLNHRDDFYWMDTSVECPPPLVWQFWSHDTITKNLEEITRILA
jgi:hypothetical protein